MSDLTDRHARRPATSCGSVEQTGNPRAGCKCLRCSERRAIKTATQKAAREAARHAPETTGLPDDTAPVYLTRAELEELNARNRAAYAAAQQAKEDAKAIKAAARKAGLAERRARMMESSCGSVEQTGNPRKGCGCDTCARRRKAKNTQRRRNRARNSLDDRDENWTNEYRQARFEQYGITEADYYAMLRAQDYRCPICGTTEPGGQGRNRSSGWHIDHDHKTGKVRGLLCHNCNIGLGNFKDSTTALAAAIEYLKTETGD